VEARSSRVRIIVVMLCDIFQTNGHFVRDILWYCCNRDIENCLPYCWHYV
jgi:hypothetical protein